MFLALRAGGVCFTAGGLSALQPSHNPSTEGVSPNLNKWPFNGCGGVLACLSFMPLSVACGAWTARRWSPRVTISTQLCRSSHVCYRRLRLASFFPPISALLCVHHHKRTDVISLGSDIVTHNSFPALKPLLLLVPALYHISVCVCVCVRHFGGQGCIQSVCLLPCVCCTCVAEFWPNSCE